jgi:hypothetical protein
MPVTFSPSVAVIIAAPLCFAMAYWYMWDHPRPPPPNDDDDDDLPPCLSCWSSICGPLIWNHGVFYSPLPQVAAQELVAIAGFKVLESDLQDRHDIEIFIVLDGSDDDGVRHTVCVDFKGNDVIEEKALKLPSETKIRVQTSETVPGKGLSVIIHRYGGTGAQKESVYLDLHRLDSTKDSRFKNVH